jgi:hypothetical protein
MPNAYYAADYGNTPVQKQEFIPVVRPFNVEVNSTTGASYGTQGYAPVKTLGIGDTIALCTLPGSGSGIVLLDWFLDVGIIDSNGSPLEVMELGLVLDTLDPNQTSCAAAGFFATGITPGTTGGRVSPQYAGLSATVVSGAVPFSISNTAPTPNAGLYDLVLQVTTAAATVSATAAYIRGWIKYAQISQSWAN